MGDIYLPADITVVEYTKKAGTALGSLRRLVITDLEKLGIKIMTETALEAVEDGCVLLKDMSAENESGDSTERFRADKVIIAMGMRPVLPEISEYLEKAGIEYTVLGDACEPKTIMAALQAAYKWSLEI